MCGSFGDGGSGGRVTWRTQMITLQLVALAIVALVSWLGLAAMDAVPR
jgi:hypothetical protein